MKLYTNQDISKLEKLIPPCSGIFAIIDNKVEDYFSAMKNWKIFPLRALESSKTLGTAANICSWLMENKADRDCGTTRFIRTPKVLR